MDMLENEENKESVIPLEDFPFICRICCLKQNKLRWLKEDYLLDLFQAIRKDDARLSVEYPGKICDGCVSGLEDISLFINISKCKDAIFRSNASTKKEMVEYTDNIKSGMPQQFVETSKKDKEMSFQESQRCQICFSTSNNLTPFEEKTHLVHLFQYTTNIKVKAESNSSKINNMCHKCINQLEKTSSLIKSSLRYDQKLEIAIETNNATEIESYSNPVDIKLATFQNLKPGCATDGNETVNRSTCTDEAFVHASKDNLMFTGIEERVIEIKEEVIDIKEEVINIKKEVIDIEVVASAKRHYQNTLEFHYETFSEEEKLFNGELGEEFPSSLHLKNHNNEEVKTQSVKNSFKCNWCKKTFTYMSNLQQHVLTHTGEKPFKCDCCGKRFTQKSSIKMHMLIHVGKKPFKCDCCEKSFTQKSTLQQHVIIHTGNKPFKCEFCEKSFSHKSTFQRHMPIHTGEKPFECHCCGKSFTYRTTWHQHMLTHTEQKPFKCGYCEKSYSYKPKLHQHVRSHTREKPFQCESCEKSFTQKLSSKIHMLTHNREKSILKQLLLAHTEEKLFKCDC